MSRVEVVTHVHWDREWYRTFDGFRARLIELVDAVLDQLDAGQLPSFLLDGQTSVVDDYLEVRPEQRDRLAEHVAAGRLGIGPWFVLADMTLVSTESLLRNLARGARRAEELGGRTDVGYCPDMFGHPPELPGLLAGFGIGHALVWRGADPATPVFRWRGSDGTQVTTLRSRYYEPEVLWEQDGAAARLDDWVAARRAEQPEGPWLLLNGGDHLAPRDLAARLAQLPQEPAVVPTTLGAHLAALDRRDLPVVTGALRRPGVGGAFLLAGVLSVRPALKQANAAAQSLLEAIAEPLAARAVRVPGPAGAATELPGDAALLGLLDAAWQQLLLGHPHDSICGCATDQVASDTLRRFARAQEVGTQVAERAAARLGLPVAHRAVTTGTPAPGITASRRDRVHLAVYNPLAAARGGEVEIDLHLDAASRPFRLRDSAGSVLPLSAVARATTDDMVTDVATPPRWGHLRRWQLWTRLERVPPTGWTSYVLELDDGDPAQEGASQHAAGPGADGLHDGDLAVAWDAGRAIANGRFEVEVETAGTLAVTDRRTGRRVSGLARLVDGGERGDTYNHDAPLADEQIALEPVAVARQRGPVAQLLRIDLAAQLPAGLCPDRDRRRPERVPCTARLEVRLGPDDDTIGLAVDVDTTAEDHRLRLHLPTGVMEERFVTDGGTAWQQHPVRTGVPRLPDRSGAEADPGTEPAHRFVAVGAGDERLALLLSSVHEVAALQTPQGVELAVTLLRAVGRLGYHDLRTRTMGAGPPVPTPSAQTPGQHRFRLGLRLADDDAALTAAAWGWRTPLHVFVLSAAPAHPEHRGIEVDGAQLSAWKPADDGDGWIVRIANPTPRPVTAEVRLPVGAEVARVRLDETTAGAGHEPGGGSRVVAQGEPLTATLAPSALVTWRVRPDGAAVVSRP